MRSAALSACDPRPRPAGAAIRRWPGAVPGPVAVPEGHPERSSRRAHEPRGASGRPRAARRPHGRDPPAQPAERDQQHRHRHDGRPAGALSARRGGRPGHRHRPEVRGQPLGLRLLLAEAQHPDGRLGTGINEGDAPENLTTRLRPGAAGAVQRVRPAVALQVPEQPARLRDRAGDHPRADVARHLLPCRRPDRLRRPGQPVPVDRRRHEPVPVGGLRAARRSGDAQSGVRLAAHVRQHERPPRQAPAHPRAGERRVHRPAGQPVPAGPGADPSRDLRDGLPQPVPLRGQPEERGRLRRRLLARRPGGGSGTRPRGHRQVDDRPPAGQLRLAVLHHAGQAVRRLRLHAGCAAVGRRVQLQRADQRLAEQHRPAPAAGGRLAGRVVLVQHGQDLFPELFNPTAPGGAGNGIGPMGGPAMQFDATSSRRSGGRACSRGIRSSTSGRGTTRRSSS